MLKNGISEQQIFAKRKYDMVKSGKSIFKRINLLIKDIQKVLKKVLVSQNLYRQKRDKSEAPDH